MHNQENLESKKLTKQEYNKLYYKKNKSKWGDKKKSGAFTNVFQLFSKGESSFFKNSNAISYRASYLRWIEVGLLVALVITITSFLVQEAANFYLEAHESMVSAYLKAGLMEGIAVLFTLSRSKHSILNWAQKIVAVLLCGFTLWVMSGKLVNSAISDTSKVRLTKQTLEQLESELTQKEQLRNQFLTKGWLGATRRYEKGMVEIRDKILTTRQELSHMQSPQAVMNGLSILILFRLLLVVANLICIHRIAEQLSTQFELEKVIARVERLNTFLN